MKEALVEKKKEVKEALVEMTREQELQGKGKVQEEKVARKEGEGNNTRRTSRNAQGPQKTLLVLHLCICD